MQLIWRQLFLIGAIVSLVFLQGSDTERLYQSCTAPVPTDVPTVPQGAAYDDGAFFAHESIAHEYQPASQMAELGFDHALALMNIVSVYPCDRGREARVEIRSLRILRLDSETGQYVREQKFDFKKRTQIQSTVYFREPNWFTSGQTTAEIPVLRVTHGKAIVEVRPVPLGIIHAWTSPRLQVVPGQSYFIEAKVRVTGDARLQFGMDYWRGADSPYNGWSAGCKASNNCQAWLSDWLGDTNGEYIVWRIPAPPSAETQ